MCPSTIFHEILLLVMNHVPEEFRLHFYRDLLHLLGKYHISLDFLIGHDDCFDHAHRKFKNND